jgi:hypothetical protein
MAYRRAARASRRGRSTARSYGSKRNYRAAPRKAASRSRKPAAKRRAAPQRTIRIVIEQPQVSAVSRPDMLVPKVEGPKKAKF